MAEPFRMALRADPQDIDENGHVNNAVYVRWLQEVATSHWYAVAPPEDVERFFWVISRHEIDYLKASHLGETLEAETWGENPRGARFDRRTTLMGPSGDRRVEARTTWVLMDKALARPARVPKAMMALFERG
jgi:acyl-CoA thioester hydrolase